MPDLTPRTLLRDEGVNRTLDDVLAACLTIMERGQSLDRAAVLAQYPQWADELQQFFANWDEMEWFSSRLGDCRRQLSHAAVPAEQIRNFGDYELIEEVGRGGMGIIYKARQLGLDRVVAVKMILDRRRDRERFRLEAELAAGLEHPHIVSIYEVGEFDGHPYFSMQFIDGQNLSELLRDGPVGVRRAAELTIQLAHAVHYAHQRGVLHRDLKPANVLLDTEGNPHVTDFGLAKQLQGEDISQITETGAILGTPSYMSPEQADGHGSLTTATDVYGLGAILYSLLTGKPPFSCSSSLGIIRQVVERKPSSPREKRPEVPRDLETICLKCLEKEPAARYASAQALAEDLGRFLRHEPIEARPVRSVERFWRWCRRNPVTAALALAVSGLLVGTSIVTTSMARWEHQARHAAEMGRQREEQLRSAVDQAMLAEKAARQAAVGALVDSFTTNGLLAHEQDDPNTALLWFHQALGRATPASHQYRQCNVRYRSWLAQTPRPTHAQQFAGAEPLEISFHANGEYLLCRSRGACEVWNLRDNVLWPISAAPQMTTAIWHPQQPWLAVSDDTGCVTLVNPAENTEVWYAALDDIAEYIAFSQDGVHLAAAHAATLTIWSGLPNPTEPATIAHPDRVTHVDFDTQGKRCLTTCADGKLRVFELRDKRWQQVHDTIPCQASLKASDRLAVRPRFMHNDTHILTALDLRARTGHSVVQLHHARTGARRLGRQIGNSQGFALSPDRARFLNVGEYYSRITENDLQSHQERLLHRGQATSLGFSRDGEFVATGSSDRMVRIWRARRNPFPEVVLNTGRPTSFVIPHQQAVVSLAWADRHRIATAQADGLVRVWELPADGFSTANGGSDEAALQRLKKDANGNATADGSAPTSQQESERLNAARFSSDGKKLVLAGKDGQVRVLQWPGGNIDAHELSHQGTVLDAAFTRDGKHILTMGSEGLLKIWIASTGQLAVRPIVMSLAADSIVIGDDPRYALLVGAKNQAKVIDLHVLQDDPTEPSPTVDEFERQRLFAELISGKRSDAGGVVNLSTEQWLERWERYRQ
jgi:WD40 repeat protein/tRNA A-37 threonylcarbamoyl transferase component Bud32